MFTFHFPQSQLQFEPDNCHQPCQKLVSTSIHFAASIFTFDSAKQIGILLTSSSAPPFAPFSVYLQSCTCTSEGITPSITSRRFCFRRELAPHSCVQSTLPVRRMTKPKNIFIYFVRIRPFASTLVCRPAHQPATPRDVLRSQLKHRLAPRLAAWRVIPRLLFIVETT